MTDTPPREERRVSRSSGKTPFYGAYWVFFGIVEPVLTLVGAGLAFADSAAFYHDIVPSKTKPMPLNHRANILVWQLGNCYFLLALITVMVYNAIPRALPNNPAGQEIIFRAVIIALAIADISHIGLTLLGLPVDILYNIDRWNSVVHGNVTITSTLFLGRLLWLSGVGRKSYLGRPRESKSA